MRGSLDDKISQLAVNKLASRGLSSPCRITVQTTHGQVTLSGIVPFAHQKTAAATAIGGLAGVRRVINQITVTPAAKR